MARSHPPTLVTLARRALSSEGLAPRGSTVLVAVSGGPDSMALLHVLSCLAARLGFGLFAHGVDHGLRPAASVELDLAESYARSLGVPFGRTAIVLEAGGNLMARARTARYEALARAARAASADRVATAHHADDRAETFVMRLLRGAGPSGLAVLPPMATLPTAEGALLLVRPLLRARKAAILAHCARHAVPSMDDPSNRDPRFLRTRVRADVLPRMEELSPALVDHLSFLADELASLAGPPGSLPRRTRLALAALEGDPAKIGEIALPGGLVAARIRPHSTLVVRGLPTGALRRPTKGRANRT